LEVELMFVELKRLILHSCISFFPFFPPWSRLNPGRTLHMPSKCFTTWWITQPSMSLKFTETYPIDRGV
jgi:hypothetical protein